MSTIWHTIPGQFVYKTTTLKIMIYNYNIYSKINFIDLGIIFFKYVDCKILISRKKM